MAHVEIEAAGVVLAGWMILSCYLAVCLMAFFEPIERALCRGWRVVAIAVALRRDAVLGYGWRRGVGVARWLA